MKDPCAQQLYAERDVITKNKVANNTASNAHIQRKRQCRRLQLWSILLGERGTYGGMPSTRTHALELHAQSIHVNCVCVKFSCSLPASKAGGKCFDGHSSLGNLEPAIPMKASLVLSVQKANNSRGDRKVGFVIGFIEHRFKYTPCRRPRPGGGRRTVVYQ